MKVLLVDDSKAMRMIVARMLKQAGFSGLKIIEASDGSEALPVIAAEQPDVVLSDWNMPVMKGIDLLRNLRESGNEIRFGFVTSETSQAIRDEAEAAGAAFVITKPFTAADFETALTPVLS